MKVDLFEFARHGETASGAAPLVALDRIETPGPPRDRCADVTARRAST